MSDHFWILCIKDLKNTCDFLNIFLSNILLEDNFVSLWKFFGESFSSTNLERHRRSQDSYPKQRYTCLTLSWQSFLLYISQFINLFCQSMDRLLHDRELLHKTVTKVLTEWSSNYSIFYLGRNSFVRRQFVTRKSLHWNKKWVQTNCKDSRKKSINIVFNSTLQMCMLGSIKNFKIGFFAKIVPSGKLHVQN